ncbi:hypothetical protein INR49_017095 [Caranx melampygus]|nr:hypothetical protein INR49_017095 [Caranx melampygus]
MFYKYSSCVLILYILPLVCMVLVCLFDHLFKDFYQFKIGNVSAPLKLIDSPKT